LAVTMTTILQPKPLFCSISLVRRIASGQMI
jgi:hypothetical protein